MLGPRTSTSRAARLALLAFGLAAGLGLVEIGLRAYTLIDTPLARRLAEWDPDDARLEPVGTHCFRGRPGTAIRYANGAVAHVNRLGYRGPEVATPKPPGTYRVVLLGGSTSHGCLVDDDETIDAHLRRELARRMPARVVEVVNLGFDGLDAFCDAERLRLEGLTLDPDAVIIHTGVNDAVGVRFAALGVDAPERGFRVERRSAMERRLRQSGVWRALKHAFLVARVPGIVRSLSESRTPASGPPAPAAAALDAFEAMVRRTATLARPDLTVILSTPPSALLRPHRSSAAEVAYLVVDAATTQRYRDALDERLRRLAVDLALNGRAALYVPHALPDAVFLDDCHLDGEGNRLVAEDFARALSAAM